MRPTETEPLELRWRLVRVILSGYAGWRWWDDPTCLITRFLIFVVPIAIIYRHGRTFGRGVIPGPLWLTIERSGGES